MIDILLLTYGIMEEELVMSLIIRYDELRYSPFLISILFEFLDFFDTLS